MRAECTDTRSKSMEMLTLDQLCTLLMYALERMQHAGVSVSGINVSALADASNCSNCVTKGDCSLIILNMLV